MEEGEDTFVDVIDWGLSGNYFLKKKRNKLERRKKTYKGLLYMNQKTDRRN